MEQATEATTVLCAAGCGHAAWFEDSKPEAIARELAAMGWVDGVCKECALMGCKPKSRLDRSMEAAEAICEGRR